MRHPELMGLEITMVDSIDDPRICGRHKVCVLSPSSQQYSVITIIQWGN